MARKAAAQNQQDWQESQNDLSVYQTEKPGEYFVESAEGNICYRVTGNNGNKSCTCEDFLSNVKKDPGFMCKHIWAVIGINGNAAKAYPVKNSGEPKLDDRFITKIQGREFVVYSGVLDLAHQKGLKSIIVEAIQLPTQDNGMEAICKAFVESVHCEEYIEYGDANPKNVNAKIASHILRMAATRAKARALRDFTNIGMTCLEELGDLKDVAIPKDNSAWRAPSGKAGKPAPEKPTRKAPPKEVKPVPGSAPPDKTQKKADPIGGIGGRLTKAQFNAILNLAGRRKIHEEDLERMSLKMFATELNKLTAENAGAFIRHLQNG